MKNPYPHWIQSVISYQLSVISKPANLPSSLHILFSLVDHFEPFGYPQPRKQNMLRLDQWLKDYPASVDGLRDSTGHPIRHTLFCAAEDYAPDYMDKIQSFCQQGHGEVEIHLHHRNDTQEGFRQKLTTFRDQLHNNHGLLGTDKNGNASYGFIHGNWALCNSRHDHDWCGVNEELSILKETGCYADFTFPSAPDSTQPKLINAIYHATDNPHGHGANTGIIASVNTPQPLQPKKNLTIITGPVTLNWHKRKYGILPRLENSDISASRPPTPQRADLWVKQNIHVIGQPNWIFIKVHTHGMVPPNTRTLFGDAMRQTHNHLQQQYNDGTNYSLHYVTAREMYNIISAAQAGKTGNPSNYRNYKIKWFQNSSN